MSNDVVRILELCMGLVVKARLLTAYGNSHDFQFPLSGSQSMWFTEPYKDRIHIQYPPTFHHYSLFLLPNDDSKLMHFFNRIKVKNVHQWQDSYSSGIDQIYENAGNAFYHFKTAHQQIILLLRDIIRFLCATDGSFEEYKKNTISGIQHCKQTFAKHLMLHESHCEQILIEIETLVNNSQQASYIDRKFDLYCLLLIILLDTTEEKARIYSRMVVNQNANTSINDAIENITRSNFFGCSRTDVIQVMAVANKNLRNEILAELEKFKKLNTTLMLCYCDAKDFIRNLRDYAKGDTAAIDFEGVKAETESKCNITKEIRSGLIEGELYQELNLQTLYQPVFESANRNSMLNNQQLKESTDV